MKKLHFTACQRCANAVFTAFANGGFIPYAYCANILRTDKKDGEVTFVYELADLNSKESSSVVITVSKGRSYSWTLKSIEILHKGSQAIEKIGIPTSSQLDKMRIEAEENRKRIEALAALNELEFTHSFSFVSENAS